MAGPNNTYYFPIYILFPNIHINYALINIIDNIHINYALINIIDILQIAPEHQYLSHDLAAHTHRWMLPGHVTNNMYQLRFIIVPVLYSTNIVNHQHRAAGLGQYDGLMDC